MKNILMTLMASMLLLSSTTYAQSAATHNTHMVQKTSFSKKDAQALFGTNRVKAVALNNGEMAKTEGEYWWYVVAAAAAFFASSNAQVNERDRIRQNGGTPGPGIMDW